MYPGLDPITFTFSENSNYGRESMLAGYCQKTFFDIKPAMFCLINQVNFPTNLILIFTEGEGDGIESRLSS